MTAPPDSRPEHARESFSRIARAIAVSVTKDSLDVYWTILKTMVPVLIAVRLADQLGLIEPLAAFFAPVMQVVGLPGEMAIVWLTAMCLMIYPALALLALQMTQVDYTVAQITIISGMMLIAHALPIEALLLKRTGTAAIATTVLRVVSALLFGLIVHHLSMATGWLNGPAPDPIWAPPAADLSWLAWGRDSAIALLWILPVIAGMLLLMDVLKRTGMVTLIGRALEPMLRQIGIGPAAGTMTFAGVLVGVIYGAAPIIREAKNGELSDREVFLAAVFLSLCHAIIEDSLILMDFGADGLAIVGLRFLLAFVIVWVLARCLRGDNPLIGDKLFYRWLFVRPRTVAG